jgi:minor histocompatibility antigen H13
MNSTSVSVSISEQWKEPTLVHNVTNEIAYLLFDNQIVNATIGSSTLSQLFLLAIAITAITSGCFASIRKPVNALKPSKSHPLYDITDSTPEETEEGEDQNNDEEQQLTLVTVIILPIMASMALVGMYYATKKGYNLKLEKYIKYYTSIMAFVAVSFTVKFLYEAFSRKLRHISGIGLNHRYGLTLWNDPDVHEDGIEYTVLPNSNEREKIIREENLNSLRVNIPPEAQTWNVYFSTGTMIGFVSGFVFATLFTWGDGSQNWILTNILGFSLVAMGIAGGAIPNFMIGTLLLSLFFIYDIYFVFGTDIMQTVATKVDIPAKLVMPNIVSREDAKITKSILGLGDLALPGAFIALCLRYDLHRYHTKYANTEFHYLQRFEKPYFTSAMIAYALALIVTFKIVQVYQKGQPALLYLCPAVIGAVYATAAWRGELKELWTYTEIIDGKHEVSDEDVKTDEDTNSDSDSEGQGEIEEDINNDDFVLLFYQSLTSGDELPEEDEGDGDYIDS